MTLKFNFLLLLIYFSSVCKKSKNFPTHFMCFKYFLASCEQGVCVKGLCVLVGGTDQLSVDQRMGSSVLICWKTSYERKHIEFISFLLIYV